MAAVGQNAWNQAVPNQPVLLTSTPSVSVIVGPASLPVAAPPAPAPNQLPPPTQDPAMYRSVLEQLDALLERTNRMVRDKEAFCKSHGIPI